MKRVSLRLPRSAPRVFALLLAAVLAAPAYAGEPLGALQSAARAAGLEVGAAVDTNATASQLALAAREFTSMTTENRLKWGQLAPSIDAYVFEPADGQVDWAESQGLRIRGHALFWHRLNGTPSWLEGEVMSAADPAARLTELMQSHATTTVSRYAGRIAQWDVVNEPLALFSGELDSESLFVQLLGESHLDIAFHAAHAAGPQAQLFLNEVLAEQVPAKLAGLVALAGRLLDRGVPLHGIGLQAHFTVGVPDRSILTERFGEIAALGLALEITELDIPLPIFASAAEPLAAQAAAYEDVFAACLAHPECTGVTTWGIDDSDTWLDSFDLTAANAPNRPLLFDAEGQPKPAYDAVVQRLPEPSSAALSAVALLALAAVSARSRTQRRVRHLDSTTTCSDLPDPGA